MQMEIYKSNKTLIRLKINFFLIKKAQKSSLN